MKIVKLNPADLIPYERNSRTHSTEQIAQIVASIREFGFTNPILVDNANGIIAGHGRVMAAQQLCLETVPCVLLSHLSEAQRRAYVIADNKLAENAGWDKELLSLELGDLLTIGFNLNFTGFSKDDIKDLLQVIPCTDGLTDPDDCPDIQDAPATINGDIWSLGHHQLMCGDSTSVDCLKILMGGVRLI